MNKLYLRIPTLHSTTWPEGSFSFALCSKDGAILREGRATLSELSRDIVKSKVVLIIAASDVTLLGITIPKMPEAKIKLALPNLVEDQLMSDAAESVLVLAAKHGNSDESNSNKRFVAVAQRSWLQQLSGSLYALGASYVKAVPEQLCIPWQSGHCSVIMEEFNQSTFIHYALRFDVENGIGVLLDVEQSLEERLSTISMLSPPVPVFLQVPDELMGKYREIIENSQVWADRFTLQEFNWLSTIDATNKVGFNLMAGLNSAHTSRIKWQIWRWPLALAAMVLLVNIVGLNGEYWAMKREAQALKMGMAQTYKVSFPKDTVVPFPLDQMKKNLQIAQRNAGQAARYDFTVLLTEFGSAWGSINPAKLPKLASIEYKDRTLVMQVKGDAPQKELEKALSEKGLRLKKNNAEVWQLKEAE